MDAGGERVVVEIKVGLVQGGIGITSGGSESEDKEAGGDPLAVVGKIFAAHGRLTDWKDAFVPEGPLRDIEESCGGGGVIAGHGVPLVPLDVCFAPHGFGGAPDNIKEAGASGDSHFGGERAHGADELDGLRDDVASGAPCDRGDRENNGIQGRDVAGCDGLEGADAVSGGNDRIAREVGISGVGLGAGDGDDKVVGSGEERAGASGDDSDGQLGPAVEGVDGFDGRPDDAAIKDAVVAESESARAAFFGGLKKEGDGAGAVRDFGEDASDTQQVGSVPVVPAGVHFSLVGRGVVKPGLLVDRQRVDIGTQGDWVELLGGRDGSGEVSGDAGAACEAGDMRDIHRGEFACDHPAGAALLVPEFGMAVQVTADRNEGREFGGDQGVQSGGLHARSVPCCLHLERKAMPERLPVTKTYKLYIDGKFPRSESGRTIELVDAAKREGKGESRTPRVLAHVCRASRKDVRDGVTAARKALAGWSGATAYLRGQVLYRMAEMLEGKRGEFAEALASGGGANTKKSRRAASPNGESEVQAAIDRIVCFAGWADKYSQVLGCNNPVAGPFYNFTVPEPVGVVGVVGPDEPGLLSLVSLVVPALASGNTVVAVAGEGAAGSLAGVLLGEVAATSDVPAGVLNILTGLREELVPVLASHRDIDAVHAGGLEPASSSVLREGVAENLKRVVVRDVVDYFDEAACHTPWWIEPLVNFKTIWHPSGT